MYFLGTFFSVWLWLLFKKIHLDIFSSNIPSTSTVSPQVGTSLLAPLEEVLLEDAGWRTTLRVVALLCTLCVLCGAAMTRPEGLEVQEEHPALLPQQEEQAPRGLVRLLLGPDLPRSPLFIPFLFVAVADALATLALFLPFLFLPDLAKDAGVEANKAATLVSVAGLSSSLGRCT